MMATCRYNSLARYIPGPGPTPGANVEMEWSWPAHKHQTDGSAAPRPAQPVPPAHLAGSQQPHTSLCPRMNCSFSTKLISLSAACVFFGFGLACCFLGGDRAMMVKPRRPLCTLTKGLAGWGLGAGSGSRGLRFTGRYEPSGCRMTRTVRPVQQCGDRLAVWKGCIQAWHQGH